LTRMAAGPAASAGCDAPTATDVFRLHRRRGVIGDIGKCNPHAKERAEEYAERREGQNADSKIGTPVVRHVVGDASE